MPQTDEYVLLGHNDCYIIKGKLERAPEELEGKEAGQSVGRTIGTRL